jgi:hypothetical protein
MGVDLLKCAEYNNGQLTREVDCVRVKSNLLPPGLAILTALGMFILWFAC